jgi:hypothetical protein
MDTDLGLAYTKKTIMGEPATVQVVLITAFQRHIDLKKCFSQTIS